MVPLPLFKLASLFVKQFSKYGANAIKNRAHDHPEFRKVAAKYGQTLHQINMRLSVATLRDAAAERRAKEKAEAPTVKTEKQAKADEAAERKASEAKKNGSKGTSTSLWRRQFRPLPEEKAVDLFAGVVGDTFVVLIGVALVLFEAFRPKKPDSGAEKLAQMKALVEADQKRIADLEDVEKQQKDRVDSLEKALDEMRRQTQKSKWITSAVL